MTPGLHGYHNLLQFRKSANKYFYLYFKLYLEYSPLILGESSEIIMMELFVLLFVVWRPRFQIKLTSDYDARCCGGGPNIVDELEASWQGKEAGRSKSP